MASWFFRPECSPLLTTMAESEPLLSTSNSHSISPIPISKLNEISTPLHITSTPTTTTTAPTTGILSREERTEKQFQGPRICTVSSK